MDVGLIRGGTVVSPGWVGPADVVLAAGRIAALGRSVGADGETVDATGCYVLPGGIDPHTHLLADIAPASCAALAGGTTTAISFTLPRPDESPVDAFVRARDDEVPQAATDVALHAYVSRPDALTEEDVEAVAELGATGVKLFTAYRELGLQASDGVVFRTLRAAGPLGIPVLVHCENGDAIEVLTEELRGQAGARAFAAARPPLVEAEAVARVLVLAELTGSRVYVVHVSTSRSLDAVRAARRRGVDTVAEVCVHHLAFDDAAHDRDDAERFLTVPPLRPRTDLEALWEGLADGTLATVGSDHGQGRFHPPAADDFTGLPYGIPGAQMRVPVALSLGLGRGLPIERLADALATAPARTFGLAAKGAIAPGADADLVVWDPEAEWQVAAEDLVDGIGDSPYEGLRLRGRIRTVVRGGRLAVSEGELVDPGPGRYVRPGTNIPAAASSA